MERFHLRTELALHMPGAVETVAGFPARRGKRDVGKEEGKVAQSICQTAADYDIHHRQSRALDCTDDARNPGEKGRKNVFPFISGRRADTLIE